MFTGIIESRGKITAVRPGAVEFEVPAAVAQRIAVGGSIAVDGACLTATSVDALCVEADVMPETGARTILGGARVGIAVNLELPATPSSFLAGHIVQGHVDGVGEVASISVDGNSRRIEVRVPPELGRYIVSKGSVAVNGVSLTVVDASGDTFSAVLVPHTWETTNVSLLVSGSRVNVEIDILAKHVERLLASA